MGWLDAARTTNDPDLIGAVVGNDRRRKSVPSSASQEQMARRKSAHWLAKPQLTIILSRNLYAKPNSRVFFPSRLCSVFRWQYFNINGGSLNSPNERVS
jgi:hypothetical protein